MIELVVIGVAVVAIVAWSRHSSRLRASGRPVSYGRTPQVYTRRPSIGDQVSPAGGPQDAPEPVKLSGYIQELSEQALAEINMVLGPSHSSREQQTYQEVADFLAAMRFYRRAVAAAFSDELINGGLGDPEMLIGGFIENYRKAPADRDRDQAIAILERLGNIYGKGVIVGMARLVLDKLAALGY